MQLTQCIIYIILCEIRLLSIHYSSGHNATICRQFSRRIKIYILAVGHGVGLAYCNVIGHINEVTLHRAGLVLRWVSDRSQIYRLGI